MNAKRKEDNMTTYVILIILMAATLLFWLIWNIRQYYKRASRLIASEGFEIEAKCEVCNRQFRIPAIQYMKHGATKEKSTAKTKVKGVVLDNSPVFSYYAKKVDCPFCHRRTWAQALNYGEYQRRYQPVIMRLALGQFVLIAIGGFVLCKIFLVISKIL